MGQNSNTECDPKELERALAGWRHFTSAMKTSVVFITASLILLAWITL